MTTLFHGATLCASLRSPFARRVRLALLENGIPFEERIYDVFKPNPDLIEANPLARVPTVILRSGMVLVESHLILQALYESVPSKLMPPSGHTDRLWIYHWSALATGLAEKVVEFYLENQRPAEKRDPEIIEEFRTVSNRVLQRLEAYLSNKRSPLLLGKSLTQADLDLATALTYMTLRDSGAWKTKYPTSARYLAELEQRPAFKKTAPPA